MNKRQQNYRNHHAQAQWNQPTTSLSSSEKKRGASRKVSLTPGYTNPAGFKKNSKNIIMSFKKIEQNPEGSHCCIPETCKILISNTLYFELHKQR